MTYSRLLYVPWITAYPRSINYQNHLHVLLDDCMHVYSFNHNWLQNQWDKLMGSEYVDLEIRGRQYK